MEQYSKRFYISNLANILSSYQNWGVDLSSLLGNIRKTDYEVYKAFLELYKKDKDNYIRNEIIRASLFYERLYKLSLDSDRLDVDFRIEPLNKYLKNYKYHTSFNQCSYDHVLTLLLLSEEFLFDNISKNDNISSYGNNLYAKGDHVEFYMRKDSNVNCNSQIIIPNEMVVNINTKAYKLTK